MKNKILTKIEDIKKIAKEISKIRNVKGIYLFGSHATGKANLLSDIDLCIIGNLNQKEETKVFGYSTDNLDISLFNNLPIWIKIRMFKEGKPIVVKDINFVNRIKIKTLREYLDFKYIINKYCEEILGCTI